MERGKVRTNKNEGEDSQLTTDQIHNAVQVDWHECAVVVAKCLLAAKQIPRRCRGRYEFNSVSHLIHTTLGSNSH